MTEFMKTVLKTLQQTNHMQFDLTTPKGLKITLSVEKKKREESKKRKIRERRKKN